MRGKEITVKETRRGNEIRRKEGKVGRGKRK